MIRDYNSILWYSEKRESYYTSEQFNKNKQQGDEGELKILNYLKQRYPQLDVHLSTPQEDTDKHVDIWLAGVSVDVKYKDTFYIELRNHWGSAGWILTGADLIIHAFPNKDYFYCFWRKDFVNYMKEHPALFAKQYCKEYDGALLWQAYPKTIEKTGIVKKIYYNSKDSNIL